MRFKPDFKGECFLFLSAVIGLLAYTHNNNYLYLLASSMIALSIVGVGLTALSLTRLRIERHFPTEAFATEEMAYTVTIANGKRWMPSLALSVLDSLIQDLNKAPINAERGFLPFIAGGKMASTTLSVAPLYRGWANFSRMRIVSQFPLSPFHGYRDFPVADSALIFPRKFEIDGRLIEDTMTTNEFYHPEIVSFTRGDDEFASIRELRPGDNPRHVHWKLSARFRDKLFVREMESNRIRDAAVLLDTRVDFLRTANKPFLRGRMLIRLERMISFTSTLAEVLILNNYRITLMSRSGEREIHEEIEPSSAGLRKFNETLALILPAEEGTDLPAAAMGYGRGEESLFLISPNDDVHDPRLPESCLRIVPKDIRALIVRAIAQEYEDEIVSE